MKLAVVTLVNDSFLIGAKVTIHSFLKNNSWFNGDIIILHSKNISFLSDNSKLELSNIYKNIIFREVNEELYSKINTGKALNARFIISYFTLEAFAIEDYDKILFIDADILVLRNIIKLTEYDSFVGTRNSLNLYTSDERINGIDSPAYVNGGVFCIPGKICGKNLLNTILKIAEPGWKKCDQDVINEWLKTQEYQLLSNKFNYMIRGLQKHNVSLNKIKKDGIRVIHYAGKYKPWYYDNESPYFLWEKPWTDYYKENL
jgi:lipopolysaccharide biosynthesis glycosyltransferase